MAYFITEMLILFLKLIGFGFLCLLPVFIIIGIIKIRSQKQTEKRLKLWDEAAKKIIEDGKKERQNGQ